MIRGESAALSYDIETAREASALLLYRVVCELRHELEAAQARAAANGLGLCQAGRCEAHGAYAEIDSPVRLAPLYGPLRANERHTPLASRGNSPRQKHNPHKNALCRECSRHGARLERVRAGARFILADRRYIAVGTPAD